MHDTWQRLRLYPDCLQRDVKTAVDQATLLSGGRNDIECVNTVQNPGVYFSDSMLSAYKSSAAESLLAERGRIDDSHRMIDETLEYAPS